MFLQVKRNNKSSFKTLNEPDDVLISQYLLSGNMELIGELFERYTHLVYGICLNYLRDRDKCKDAVMEIFESLFEKLTVHRISNFKNWLYSVTRNHCLIVLRKEGAFGRIKEKMLENFRTEFMENSNEEHLQNTDENIYSDETLMGAVDQLNTEQSNCIRLMYLEDKTYKDIADITGYSLSQVKSFIQNGKRNLKNYLLSQHDNQ